MIDTSKPWRVNLGDFGPADTPLRRQEGAQVCRIICSSCGDGPNDGAALYTIGNLVAVGDRKPDGVRYCALCMPAEELHKAYKDGKVERWRSGGILEPRVRDLWRRRLAGEAV